MREVHVNEIRDTVRRLCIEANSVLPASLEACIRGGAEKEQSAAGKSVFADLCANLDAARETGLPICQDTGMAVVFLTVGQDVHIVGGSLRDAVNEGVAAGYLDGYLRCSVVGDPLRRVNTGNNTPAVLHLDITEGESVRIDVCPKGFGSENMSALRMFTPAATTDDIVGFVRDTIAKAGSNPCPPIVVGVGIGGDFEQCAFLAKKALCRDVAKRNPDEMYAALEEKMLEAVNSLGIGYQTRKRSTLKQAVRRHVHLMKYASIIQKLLTITIYYSIIESDEA